MGRAIFFQVAKGNWMLCFSPRVNSNRGHESSHLVLTFTKYFEVAIVLFLFGNVTKYFYFLFERVI